MDHDREVDSLIAQSKSTFLQELGREFQERQKQYNLEEEFAKTKKNRSPLVVIVVTAITVILLGAAFVVASVIQSRGAEVNLGLDSAFADVNLRDVLDTVKRNEAEMQRAQERLREILAERSRRIQQAESLAQRDITLLGTRGLSQAEIDQQSATIRQRLGAEIQAIDAEFAPLIEEAEARIAEIQEQIDQYDARQLESARAQQEVLNNQQRLFEIEVERITSEYNTQIETLNRQHAQQISELEAFQQELQRSLTERYTRERQEALAEQFDLYNPTFTEAGVLRLLQSAPEPGEGPRLSGLASIVENARPYLNAQDAARLGTLLTEVETVLSRIEAIPYQNSVPESLALLRSQLAAAIQLQAVYQRQLFQEISRQTLANEDLEIELAELQRVSQDAALMDDLLNRIDQGLASVARANGVLGYVLDASDPENIIIFATDPELLDVGVEGLIFREDSRLIGRFVITKLGRPILARIESLQPGESPAPYDSLVFELHNRTSQEGMPDDTEISSAAEGSSSKQGEDLEDLPLQALILSPRQEQGDAYESL